MHEVQAAMEVDRHGDRGQRPSRAASVLLAGMVALVAGVIGFGLGWLVFDDDETSGAGSSEMPQVVERWADAWVARDADALAVLYAEDGHFDGILAVGFEGREQIRAEIGRYWADMSIAEMEPDYVFANEVGAVVIWNIVTAGADGDTDSFQAVTDFEWDWDDANLLRRTDMNW